MPIDPIVIERTLNAPIDIVWDAISDNEQMKKWYFDIPQFEPTQGFEFQFYGQGKEGQSYLHLCKVIEVMPPNKLSYTWRYEGFGGSSLVSFELFAEGEKTKLRLTHEGVETFPSDNNAFAREDFVEGWTYIIGTALPGYIENN